MLIIVYLIYTLAQVTINSVAQITGCYKSTKTISGHFAGRKHECELKSQDMRATNLCYKSMKTISGHFVQAYTKYYPLYLLTSHKRARKMGLYTSHAQWDQLSKIVYFLGTTFRNEEDHSMPVNPLKHLLGRLYRVLLIGTSLFLPKVLN